jgi:iron complex transport system substrate-binding protein
MILRTQFIRLLCFGFALALPWGSSAFAVPASSVRVVSQTVGSDEILLALAEPGQIAALSPLAADPLFSAVSAEAGKYPRLPSTGDAESVLKHNPTLVLCADYSRPDLVSQVRRAGVRVIIFDRYRTLDDVYENLRLLARELGAEERAERLIVSCRSRIAALNKRLAGVKPVRVIAPSVYGVIPGNETTFQDICNHAGAENLAATLGHLEGHAAPPEEQMLTWPIDRVVLAGESVPEALVAFRNIPPYQFMPVIREGRAVLLPPCQISCISHLRIDGYEILARALHPELFR